MTPVSGATDRMFFASYNNATSVTLFEWPESSKSPSVRVVGGLHATYEPTRAVPMACTAFDGTKPCGRITDARMQTGWVTSTELGFAWPSSQNAAVGRPYPFTRVVILNPSATTVVSEPDIWNALETAQQALDPQPAGSIRREAHTRSWRRLPTGKAVRPSAPPSPLR